MAKFLAFVLVVLSLASCTKSTPEGASSAAPPREVTVFAATSLRDALQEIAPAFEAAQKAKVVFAFGSSGDLSKQIVAADRADAFLSADEKEMDRVADASRIDPATRRDLLGNRLVVIEPMEGASGAFTGVFAKEQLADARIVRWSLANTETVPAGRYAKAWLTSVGAYAGIAERVVPGVDVRAALAAVESGGCAAGIVYATDAARSKRVRVVYTVPEAEGLVIRYPAAVVKGGSATDLGGAFVRYLSSSEARAIFERNGFVVLASSG
ncbi:MAG: molybdate ABC transporter substrate-binding protein [Planctomycetota bacterium]|nr:molybdate ABC transporter substrate-binding protein [Planctomycetota bacterium]